MAAFLKKYLNILLLALAGVFILWYITQNQDVAKIGSELREARFFWIFMALLFGVFSHVVRALRWKLLIRSLGFHPKTSTTFYSLMTGYLTNLVIPRMGEITRCATLSRYSGLPFNALAGTVVAERVFDMLCLLLLIFLTVVFQFPFLKEFLTEYVFTPLLLLVQGNYWLLILGLLTAMGLVLVFLLYLKGVDRENSGWGAKIKRQLIGFGRGVKSLFFLRHKLLFAGLSVLIWFFYFMTVYLCFFAIQATSTLGVADAFTVLALGSLGIVAPVPGGIGTYHFVVITTLTELLGVAREPATSYAYIAHATQTLMVMILGGISWLALSLKFKPIPQTANSADS